MNWKRLGDGFEYANPIQYNQEYRQVEMERKIQENDREDNSSEWDDNESEGRNSYIKKHNISIIQIY